MLYRQLSKLAVVGERSDAPRANQSRLRVRRPTPYSVEHYRHEGLSAATENDNSPDEPPRGRSRSSTFTPTRTRAPTPHPSASRSRPRNEKKTVRWTDSLEQESPEQKCEPATAPSRKKSAMKRLPATQQEEEKSTEKEEDRPDNSSEEPAKPKTDAKAGSQEDQPRTLRRDRRSSIPRPKFTVSRNISKPIALPSVAPERPPSPLIPQAVPAPLRLSQRRSQIPAIPSSASAPEVTGKAKQVSSAINPPRKSQTISTVARDFSFDDKPEVLTVDSHSAHQSRPPNTTKDKLLSSGSTSYLQAKPKRNGTVRPPAAKAERGPATPEDSSKTKISSSDASKSKPAAVDVISQTTPRSSPSPSKPLPASASASSFQSAKRFWSDLSASSSCAAVVSGSSPDPSSKPTLSMPKSSSSKDLPKTSMVSSLSAYTVNAGGRLAVDRKQGARKGGVSGSVSATAVENTSQSSAMLSSSVSSYRSAKAKSDVTTTGKTSSSKIPLPKPQDHSKPTAGSSVITTKSTTSSSSYRTAPSHLSTTSRSDIDANAPSSMAAIPTIQCELWNEIMNFCRSDSSSIPPGERYCDCDDCVWSNEKDLKECSTVARVGEGKCRARAKRE